MLKFAQKFSRDRTFIEIKNYGDNVIVNYFSAIFV